MKQLLPCVLALLVTDGCTTDRRYRIPKNSQPVTLRLETTGYCKCGKCCGWERNWFFQPVVAYGSGKGRRKAVGITASGTRATKGTIAADPHLFPFGTVMFVPGYGWGRVEDIGGGVKGKHIDLFFGSHQEALEWGREKRTVQIWRP